MNLSFDLKDDSSIFGLSEISSGSGLKIILHQNITYSIILSEYKSQDEQLNTFLNILFFKIGKKYTDMYDC